MVDHRQFKDRGGRGYSITSDDAAFLKPENADGSWTASASGLRYNKKFNDDRGHVRGANWDDSDSHGLVNKLADEHQEVAHERLARLIDSADDMGSGSKWLGGGGPVSELADDDSPGWKGSGRKGPRYPAKTGPQTNMTGWKKGK
jgi:hypothetical protein